MLKMEQMENGLWLVEVDYAGIKMRKVFKETEDSAELIPAENGIKIEIGNPD